MPRFPRALSALVVTALCGAHSTTTPNKLLITPSALDQGADINITITNNGQQPAQFCIDDIASAIILHEGPVNPGILHCTMGGSPRDSNSLASFTLYQTSAYWLTCHQIIGEQSSTVNAGVTMCASCTIAPVQQIGVDLSHYQAGSQHAGKALVQTLGQEKRSAHMLRKRQPSLSIYPHDFSIIWHIEKKGRNAENFPAAMHISYVFTAGIPKIYH